MSRTAWLVITIAGLVAFIVGGGVALVEDHGSVPGRTIVTRETVIADPEATQSPVSEPSEPAAVITTEGEGHGDNRGDRESSEGGEGVSG
jgi:hypothetical protein